MGTFAAHSSVRRTGEMSRMNALVFAIVAGITFGVLDVLLMIPFDLPDKRTAMIGAFLGRFAIGFLIPLVRAPMPPWLTGCIVGLLVSLPDAVITKAYGPIIVVGVVGGAIIGWTSGKWVGEGRRVNPF